ncbi:MAG: aminotransferase class I/II-fold pyridoxal phosphate-dependent enzyme [Candidatus Omnitrophota bacterium]
MFKLCRGRIIFSMDIFGDLIKSFFSKKNNGELTIKKFEDDFAQYIGSKHAVAVASGKMALYLTLKALGAKEGDQIIIPAYTVSEVIDVIILCKLIPVFVDINLKDANIDVSLIEKRITPNTKFILMVHMFGCPCDIDEIIAISKKYNLKVIEDGAQSCGAEYKGKKIGSFGDIGYFSFGIMKNLNTLGGGMIVAQNSDRINFIRKQINKFSENLMGQLFKKTVLVFFVSILTTPVIFSFVVYPLLFIIEENRREKIFKSLFKARPVTAQCMEKLKVKFSPYQAAIGIAGLKKIEQINQKRINNAKVLNQALNNIDGVSLIKESSDSKNIYLNYVIRINNRQKLINRMFNKGIDVSAGFIECCPDLARFELYQCDCPRSRIWEKENLYLPVYHPLKREVMIKISKLIKEAL